MLATKGGRGILPALPHGTRGASLSVEMTEMVEWSRRRFLGVAGKLSCGLAAGSVIGTARRAEAVVEPATVTDVSSGRRGVTLRFEMRHGPFPCRGHSYTDATTIVFVPHHFRLSSEDKVDTIVHFHGHNTTAVEAIERHELREQLYDSRQNAILVVPQGPVSSDDSSGGKLDQADGLLDFLTEVRKTLTLREVQRALGDAAIPRRGRIGALCLSAHSGGYRVAARCLELGGFDTTEMYLFDALYAEVDTFSNWVIERRASHHSRERHKLVSFYNSDSTVRRNNRRLMESFDENGIRYIVEEPSEPITRGEFTRNRAVFIRTGLSHSSVTHRHNNLRDCLYASCLRRRLDTDWFDDTETAREVEVRDP